MKVPAPATSDQVVSLIYELLDAHLDTIELTAEFESDLVWAAHLEYLRALHRAGREALARASADEAE
jgi:hypothetical protein